MTALGGKVPSQYSGDMITCNNQGQGLTNTLQSIQDGKGNNSAIELSLIQMKMKTGAKFSGPGSNTVVATNGLIGMPISAGDPADPTEVGTAFIYFNSGTGRIRLWNGTAWLNFAPV